MASRRGARDAAAIARADPSTDTHHDDALVQVSTMPTTEIHAMGCRAFASIDEESRAAQAALDQLGPWLAVRERALSRFCPESALYRLNARGGGDHVDEVLWDAIDVALRAAEATSGLVTPTVLQALEDAGYDRSFESLAPDGAPGSSTTRPAPDWRLVERDEATRAVWLPPGTKLDLGGTAKGAAADQALAWLRGFGPAPVDLGGDIAASPARGRWPIAIDDPRRAARDLDLVMLRGGGVATSGRDHRRWRRGGRERHHLIDPRTGVPAETDVWTATVIAPTALEADVAAKRILLEGTQRGIEWVDARDDIFARVVRTDGRIVPSARFDAHLWRDLT